MRCVLTSQLLRGCEPLTPGDIAEIIVFAAGRRENVVLADTLVFPNHQVCFSLCLSLISISHSLLYSDLCANE
jgi:hypothetical protein